jgi:hypothetical protein
MRPTVEKLFPSGDLMVSAVVFGQLIRPHSMNTKPQPWTYTSDSCGYMLFHDGKPQGGARTLGTATHTSDGRRRHWRHVKADREENAKTAKRICDERNAKITTP